MFFFIILVLWFWKRLIYHLIYCLKSNWLSSNLLSNSSSLLYIQRHLEIPHKRWHENFLKAKVCFLSSVIRWLKGHMGHTSWSENDFLIGWDNKKHRRSVKGESQTGLASFTFSWTQTHACTICLAFFLLSDTQKTLLTESWLCLTWLNFRVKGETGAEFPETVAGMFGCVYIVCVCVSMWSIHLNNVTNMQYTLLHSVIYIPSRSNSP